jgi:hypothetical protein
MLLQSDVTPSATLHDSIRHALYSMHHSSLKDRNNQFDYLVTP